MCLQVRNITGEFITDINFCIYISLEKQQFSVCFWVGHTYLVCMFVCVDL